MKKPTTNVLYIISVFLLNLLIICVFSFVVENNKNEVAKSFHHKLEEKSLEISTIINLVNAYIGMQSTLLNSHIKNYTDMIEATIGNDVFNFTNALVADESGTVLFSTLPCLDGNRACSISHRAYFKAAMLDTTDKIQVSEPLIGISSKKEAITFSKAAFSKNNGAKVITVVGLDINGLIKSLDSKSYISIVPALPNSELTDYSNKFEFKSNLAGERQLPYNLKVIYNKEFFIAAGRLFLPANALLILLIIARMNHDAIRKRVFERIQKLFPDEFENAAKPATRQDIFSTSLDALTIVGVKIEDYKGNIAKISEAIDRAIAEQKLNCSEIDYLEQEVLTLLDDMDINLNAEYKSSILELNEDAKELAQVLNIILGSLGEAMKEIISGKRHLSLKEIITASEEHFRVESSITDEKSFWLLKDLFLDRIECIRQYLTNSCHTSSLTMTASAKNTGEIVLEYKGTLNKNKINTEIVDMMNSLLHYKLKCLGKVDDVEYQVRDTVDHLILTVILKPQG